MFQSEDAQILASIALAGDGNDYADRFPDGEFLIALNNFEVKPTTDHGKIVSLDAIILESSNPQYKGKAAGEGFFISKPDKEGGKGARQRAFAVAKAVVQSLGGNPEDPTPVVDPATGQYVMLAPNIPMTKGHALVQQTLGEMTRKDQPWRGVVLRASASKTKGKNTGKEYTKVKYSPVTQNAQQIAECRKRIEATPAAAPIASVQTMSALAPVQVAQPAPSMLGASLGQPVAPAQPAAATAAVVPSGLGGSLLGY